MEHLIGTLKDAGLCKDVHYKELYIPQAELEGVFAHVFDCVEKSFILVLHVSLFVALCAHGSISFISTNLANCCFGITCCTCLYGPLPSILYASTKLRWCASPMLYHPAVSHASLGHMVCI